MALASILQYLIQFHPIFKKVIAGAEYKRNSFHQWLWGIDYRKEWTTVITVPILNLDSAYGGLMSVKEGGAIKQEMAVLP